MYDARPVAANGKTKKVQSLSLALLLLPDFTPIALGFALYRWVAFGDGFWTGLERIVYFVLFPALLFQSVSSARFEGIGTTEMLAASVAVTLAALVTSYLARPFSAAPPRSFASGVQTAFRFNSYIALAIAQRLDAQSATGVMALILAVNIPLVNVAAVFGLARHAETGVLRALVRNPLIIGVGAGLVCNALGLHPPEFIGQSLVRLGSASVALGLLAVGAGLRLTRPDVSAGLILWWSLVKLMLAPACALLIARYLGFDETKRLLLVGFGALPSASSAYILATRMGGDGPLVAFLVTSGTLAAAITLPMWLYLAR